MKIRETEHRDQVTDLSDIPVLFKSMIWREAPSDYGRLEYIISTKNSFTHLFVDGISWEGYISEKNSNRDKKDTYE